MTTTAQAGQGDTVILGDAVRPLRYLVLAVLIGLLGAGCVLLGLAGEATRAGRTRPGDNTLAVIVGVVLVGVALFLAWVSIRRAVWHGRQVIVLGPRGLFDAREQREPIPWSALQAALQLSYDGVPNVVVFTNPQPDMIRAALKPRALRSARRSRFKGTVARIESIGLACTQTELVSHLLEQGERYGAPFASGDENVWIETFEMHGSAPAGQQGAPLGSPESDGD